MPPNTNPSVVAPSDLEAFAQLHERAAYLFRRLAEGKRNNDRELMGSALKELEQLALYQQCDVRPSGGAGRADA